MILLLLGVALFAGLHLFTTLWRPARTGITARIGEGPWKGLVALGLVASIWMMGRGYGAASADVLWVAPGWLRWIAIIGMLPAFILFVGSFRGSALRARVRHPQLMGVKLWAALHLLANGDLRSVVLFGGLLAWAVVEMILLNRRDGKLPLPASDALTMRAWTAVPVGAVLWLLLLVAHPVLFGVSPFA